MDIREIAAPVADELSQVEARLAEVLTPATPETTALTEHINRHKGKRLRPLLTLLAGKVCGPLTPQHVDLAAIVEMIHAASLIHDDVVDAADMRRRLPSVNVKWGNEVAVLLGDFVFSKAFSVLSALDSPSATAILCRATTHMCEGEMRQLLRRFDATLTEDEYLEIIDAKTAELFAVSCRLGAGASGAARQLAATLSRYGRGVGMAFQIADDCLDLTGDQAKVGKTLHTDLETGRLTLPLIHAMKQESEGIRDLVFPQHGPVQRGAIVQAMARHDALAYSRDTASRFCREAKALLRPLPNTPCKQSLLALADLAIERQD